MPESRIDYHTDTQPLLRVGAALLAAGVVVAALMSRGAPWWLWLPGAAVLLACALGLFVVSARWFTRAYPVLSVHPDRIEYRGLRHQVLMLRNVAAAQVLDRRRLGVTVPVLEIELRDDDDAVEFPLWAVALDADALITQIGERVMALDRERPQT
ncbi:MAG: hypothetical protein U1E89_12950 [Burkholderiaceae bacterium]